MARVQLQIDDPANRLTLHTLLQAAGHTLGDHAPEVLITDSIEVASERADTVPVLVLASASQIRDAVAAMQRGVYGYIFVPLQPGEADVMVRRALGAPAAPRNDDSRPLNEIEADHILDVLRQCKGNRAKAARVLGVGRNTLWRKLKEIELRRQ
jgi:DNA-binding NtrC family response regulator